MSEEQVLKNEEIQQTETIETTEATKCLVSEELEGLDVSRYLDAPKVEALSLDDYRKMKEEGTIFKQTFANIDRQNNLRAFVSGGITIKMTSRHIDGFYHSKDTFDQAEALGKTYNVVVIDVKDEEKLVYVSANVANAEAREKMRALLDDGIAHESYKVVKARVIGISADKNQTKGREFCLLNIGGLGIMGTIRLGDWSQCFTASFKPLLKKDDIVRVAVTGTMRWSSSDDPVYVCSRKVLLSENPWENIEEKLRVKSMVRVTCVDCHQDHFFGKIEGFEELNAYCYYPEDPDCLIEVGKTYIGVVAKVSEETRNLKVRFPKKK